MDPGGNSSSGTLSWGAPATGASITNPTQVLPPEQNTHSSIQSHQQIRSPNPSGYQRHSPYHNNSNRGRHGNFQNKEEKDSTENPFHNQGNFSPSNPFQSQGQRLSSSNPFQSPGPKFSSGNPYQGNLKDLNSDSPSEKAQNFSPSTRFSSGNPYQKGQASSSDNLSEDKQNFSPGNHFQRGGQFSGRNRQFHPRPRFQSSPLSHQYSPGGNNPRFSPRTPSNFSTPSQDFYTGSPRFPQRTPRGGFDSSKRGFQRNKSMSNPGGSDNIRDYIHPSMLEDPWKDLPATPMLQSY